MSKRRYVIPGLAIAAILALGGCSQPPQTGTVKTKVYEPSYMYFIMSGKVLVPVTHPECWRVNIETPQLKRASWCTTETRWNAVKVGDEFTAVKGDW